MCRSRLPVPEEGDLEFEDALKLLGWIRRETDGNCLKHDGSSNDTKSNRALWAEQTPRILECLKRLKLGTPEADCAYTECIMYSVSSVGIPTAAVNGKGAQFLGATERLVANHPDYDGGVPHIFYGGMKLALPWPLRDVKFARASFAKALAVEETKIALYYNGVAALNLKDRSAAKDFFTRCLATPPVHRSEFDLEQFLNREAQLGLNKIG